MWRDEEDSVPARTGEPETPHGMGQATNRYPFRFNGRTEEFALVWLLNVILSVITVGIYSGRAKVRIRRYLMGNTVLEGSRFDYHASPTSILRSRLTFVGILVLIPVLVWMAFFALFTLLK